MEPSLFPKPTCRAYVTTFMVRKNITGNGPFSEEWERLKAEEEAGD